MALKQIKTLLEISQSGEIMRRYFVVNGIAPLFIALIIVVPWWLARSGMVLAPGPLPAAMAVALVIIFLPGVFLGRVGGTFWLWSGLQSLAVAVLTLGLIYLVA